MHAPRSALTSLSAAAILLMAAPAAAATHDAKASGTIDVHASLSHKVLPNYASSDVYASVKMTAREFVSEKRVPLNIALVIDRSSSMSGEKIRQARRAAQRLVEVLEPQDRLTIVSYSSDVTVDAALQPVDSSTRVTFNKAIEKLQPGGFTYLSGGFAKGCDIISNSIREGAINRVLLMSDGQANRGITDKGELGRLAQDCLERGVSATTIGLGLDYNEDIMTAMAIKGAGNYHFIEDETTMARAFQLEATGLASTVAKGAKLVVKLADGVELIKVHGFSHREKNNVVTIPLAEFSSKQQKDVLMRLVVSAQKAGKRPVVSVRVVYEDVLNAEQVDTTLALSASISGDKKVVAKNVDTDVFAHAQRVEVAQTMDEAMTEYEKGNAKGAVKMLEAQQERMNAARETYDFEDDSAYDRVDGEMDSMKSTISKNRASSKRGKKLRKAKKKRSYDIMNSAESF